jgi:DNA repair exonuclease SbcCD nuclease subunit
MKIDVCSDIHSEQWWSKSRIVDCNGPRKRTSTGLTMLIDWEWYKNKAGGDGEILIIAGDLSDHIDTTKTIIEQAAEVYSYVFFVDGNHDHFNKKLYSLNMQILNGNNLDNVRFLNPLTVGFIIEDIAILGCNGWYDWSCYELVGYPKDVAKADWIASMADTRLIRFDQGLPDDLAAEHSELLTVAISETQLNDEIKDIIVVTHTSPLAALMQWKDNEAWDRGTPSFVNSEMIKVLQADVNHKIKYWIYGHTHQRQTIDLTGIKFINKCRGYPYEIKEEWLLQRIEIGKP